MDISTSCTGIIILLYEVFKYGDIAEFWGYVGTRAQPLLAEFCDFGQYHNLKYLTFATSEWNKLMVTFSVSVI
jgi:hypothetical protein